MGSGSLTVDVGNIAGDGWQADAVALVLDMQDSGELAGNVTASSLRLPAPIGRIDNAVIRCGRIVYSATHIGCDASRIEPGDVAAGLPALVGRVDYRTDTGILEFDLAGDIEDGSGLRLTGRVTDASWSLDVIAEALQLGDWADAISALRVGDTPTAPVGQGELSGQLDLTFEARGHGETLDAVFEGRADGLTAYNAAGTTASEGVVLEFTGQVGVEAGQTRFEAQLTVPAGEFYQEPVYANLADHPVTVALRGQATGTDVELEEIRVRQVDVLTAGGSASVGRDEGHGWRLKQAALRFETLVLPGAYDVLLQPLLADTDLANLETTGSLSGELRLADNAITTAAIEIRDVHMDDREGRLAVYGLNADLVWGAGGSGRPMWLRWDGGFVYGISYGAVRLDLEPRDGGWALAGPVAIPVLDGALEIDVLEFGDVADDEARMAFDARLTPVDMRSLARALDWPPLSGTLSGEIPSLSYENGEISIAGALEARMFDGTVTVADLRIREPFSERAILQADMDMQALDLRLVTEAFAFGLITGRLDGYVRDLVMVDWSPKAFDARLYTSRGGKSRRRISQRAVDNIASLGGGGGAAALSSGFLRFFDDFAYDRISLGCRLDRKVCAMSGIEPAGTGYLILRGRGLPQINVVGFSRQVSWPTVVAQLQTILESEGPVIE